MTEILEPGAATGEPTAVDVTERVTQRIARAKSNILDMAFGTQRAMLEEIVFASNEMMDRAKTETHLFTEFVQKMAGAHSVKDIRTMIEECGQHQIDFIRRDCERILKHGQHVFETTSKLLENRPLN
jgi:hypothetical protein